MKTFKKLISVILTVTMIIGLMSAVYAVDDSSSEYESYEQDWTYTDENEEENDLSGEEFNEILGDGSEYQITDFTLSEDNTAAEVTYLAVSDATLVVSFKDENSAAEVYRKEIHAEAGQNTIFVEFDTTRIPEFFWVDITLENDGAELSDIFTYIDRTSEYLDFINASIDDPEYADNVILDYGVNEEGKDNFAVVRSDVKVVYVENADDVETIGEDNADLFGLMGESQGYAVSSIINEEVVDSIESGDKLLILPMDDVNGARVLTVESIEENADLFGEKEGTSFEVTSESGEKELEDYFDYVRLDITIKADTDDIDTRTADEDIEFLDEVVVDDSEDGAETAELFDSKTISKTASASLTAKLQSGKVTIKDTITVTATVKLVIDYKTVFKIPTKLNKVEASSKLEVKNVFNISSSAGASYKPDPKKIGTIPVGTVAGVTFSIPVYFTFSATFAAKFDFTATQTASSAVTATYKSGSFSVSTSKSASSSKTIETEAKVVVRVGLRVAVEATFLKIITASVIGDAGVQAVGTVQSINSTSTYRHTNVIACLDVTMDIYLQPSFKLKLGSKTLADKKWSETTKRFLAFYIHKKANKGWVIGTGYCPYREYLVKYTVKDGKNGKAISGVAIKEGSKTLGTTNSKGQANIWLSIRSHTLKLSKSGYNTGTSVIYVSSSFSKDYKLYKKGSANDAIVSMTDLYNIADEEWESFTNEATAELAGNIGNTIIQIASKDDLVKLAEFTARTDRSTANIRFQFNNETSSIDMSGTSWTPIGTAESPFKGLVDGNKFTITGLTGSLFGVVEDAEIHDLTIQGAAVSASGDAGVLAGSAKNSKIYDIGVIGGTVTGSFAGGIIGVAEQTQIINSFCTAEVAGSSAAGGIAGKFAYTDAEGKMDNVYFGGTVSSSNAGGIAGIITYESGAAEEGEIYDVGIYNAYFLEGAAAESYGSKAAEAQVKAYPVTETQAKGEEDEAVIAGEDEYANSLSLLEALNKWYTRNGAISIKTESEEDPDAQDGIYETEVPESSPNDYYNHWFKDGLDEEGNYSNAGLPTFGEKAAVYKLTVEYVYEDGSEAKPTVVLFFTEGQAYDVDTVVIPGYHTYEDSEEYKGNMPANDLEYRVIYMSDSPYTDTMTNLAGSGSSAEVGTSYSISTKEELELFSEYVNSGKNTSGVTFVQIEEIALDPFGVSNFKSIGTEQNKFKGTYEGQNSNIKGLSTSLFGYTENAKINEVSASSIDLYSTSAVVMGSIVANAVNTEITMCSVSGMIQSPSATVGGIVAIAKDTVIDNCVVEGSVITGGISGGIAGTISGGKIINCSNSADVAAKSAPGGGIAGKTSDNAIITNCYATCNVSGDGVNGGIVGSAANTEITNVYYSGTVSNGDAVVKEQGSGLTVDSVWFNTESISTVSGGKSFAPSAAGVTKLLEGLTEWVNGHGTAEYLTWSLPAGDDDAQSSTAETPVFGAGYANWIMNIDLTNGSFKCVIDITDYPEGKVYIAFYNASGQMKSIVEASQGENSFNVANNVVSAKAFVVGAEMTPMTEAVISK